MSTGADLSPLEIARGHAELGMPLGRPTRFRFVKRLLYRVSWLFLSHQVAVNHGLVDALAETGTTLRRLEEQLAELRDQQNVLATDMVERLDLGLRQAFLEMGNHTSRMQTGQADLQLQIGRLAARLDGLTTSLGAELRDEAAQMRAIRAEASVVIDRVRRALPEPIQPGALQDEPSAWDDLYLPFEDAFRGSAELIKSRLAVYLDDVRSIDRGDRLVLDVGCGRGDWLDLLAQNDIKAYGIDLDKRSVEQAAANGLDARHEDAFDHLADVPPGSVAALTCFHMVEHVGIENIVALLDLSLRALMPGGLLILETPNPENLMVGSNEFYMDPTHRNPIPPSLLAFLVGSRGFADRQIRRLRRGEGSPVPESTLAELDPALASLLRIVESRVLVGEDYAVLARRG